MPSALGPLQLSFALRVGSLAKRSQPDRHRDAIVVVCHSTSTHVLRQLLDDELVVGLGPQYAGEVAHFERPGCHKVADRDELRRVGILLCALKLSNVLGVIHLQGLLALISYLLLLFHFH